MIMSNLVKGLKKNIKIYLLFMKYNLLSQMEYRVNFLCGIVLDVVFFLSKMIYAIIIYNSGVNIKGLSPDNILLFVGTFSIMTSIYIGLFMVNLSIMLPMNIKTGNLDVYITKPLSLQFMVTTRYVEFPTILPDMIGGIIITCIAWHRCGINVSIITILQYLLFLFIGVCLTYSLFLLFHTLAFYFIETSALKQITNALWDMNKMTMKIYSKSIQVIGVFIFPIFIICNFGPLFVLNRLNSGLIVWAIIITPVLFIVSKKFFEHAVKRYTSASC